jgi:enoyl-CoA hydratase/carnithine racemase
LPSGELGPEKPAGPAHVEVERRDAVTLVWLNRPERRNAFDLEMMYDFGSALTVARDDEQVAVVVLAARGPVFSSGVDLKAYAALASDTGSAEMDAAAQAGDMDAAAQAGATADRPGLGVLIRDRYPKPVVVAVQGPAIGLGCDLVLACDIVVASAAATFALPEVRHGLTPSDAATARLLTRLPAPRALWMLLSGEPVDIVTAERFGLVTAVVGDDEDPVEIALRMAAVIAGHPQAAVRAAKALAVSGIALTVRGSQPLRDARR